MSESDHVFDLIEPINKIATELQKLNFHLAEIKKLKSLDLTIGNGNFGISIPDKDRESFSEFLAGCLK